MGIVKESLQTNLDEILKNLPEEFHEDCKKQIDTVEEPSPLSEAEEFEAIKAELINNPDVIYETEAIADFEANPTAHKAEAQPSEE